MIYLIGGPPRCGKTIVARELSRELGVPWISTDTLESIITGYVADSEWRNVLPKSAMRELTHNSNDEMYGRYSAEEIVAAYREQAKISFKGVEIFTETILKDGGDFIIEGHQLQPRLMASLKEKYSDDIAAVMLIRKDVRTIAESAKSYTRKGDWFVEKTRNEETFGKIAMMIKLYGEQLEKEATKSGITVINMDGNFQEATKKALTYLRGK